MSEGNEEAGIRWPAVVTLVVAAPAIVISAALTLSVFGAIFGVPGLLLSVPVGLAAVRVLRRPEDSALREPLATRATAFAVLFSVGFGVISVVGWENVDSTGDQLFVAGGVLWVIGSWWGAIGALRTREVALSGRGTSERSIP